MAAGSSSGAGRLVRLPARVLVVAGPTAAGKSELAVAVAESIGAEIVGADSRQIYREMEIATAKPTHEQRARVRHHLVDVADPDEDWDVATWRAAAMGALADVHARGRLAIVCGGTGLYLRSLERGLFAGPPAAPELRERLEAEERSRSGALHERLAEVDPASARRIHANDLVRVVRALEVHELTGRPLSAWLAEHGLAEKPFETLTLEVHVEPEVLRERIAVRSRAMARQGLVEELAALYERYPPSTRAFDAIGYRQAADVLAGRLARSGLAEAISLATVQYAKRQRTWLRGQAATVKVAGGEVERALGLARDFFS